MDFLIGFIHFVFMLASGAIACTMIGMVIGILYNEITTERIDNYDS